MSKMGISTLQSYRGAQLFEAVGLERGLVEKHFTGTPSRVEGVGLPELGREVLERHARGFGRGRPRRGRAAPVGGQYQWRRRGETHKWNPATWRSCRRRCAATTRALFAEYSRLADDETRELATCAGCWRSRPRADAGAAGGGGAGHGDRPALRHGRHVLRLHQRRGPRDAGHRDEPARRAQQQRRGRRGGAPLRARRERGLRRSAIKQVASARFGVTAEYLVNADELQIKMAQGAKPGEGGQLPGHKVDERIAQGALVHARA